jgi:hypothetical protein
MPICRHCKHADYAHVSGECIAHDKQGTCGCIRFEAKPKRSAKQRTWNVSVAFFEKNRWTPEHQVKVPAQTIGGAAMRAIREAKAIRTSKSRISQTKIIVTNVPRSGS